MSMELLDNIVWHTLTGPHACHAAGSGTVRRYASGFPALVAFANPQRPDFGTLERYAAHGEALYNDGWSGKAPAGWHIQSESVLVTMTWDAPVPEQGHAFAIAPIETQAQPAARELAAIAAPGPRGPRIFELGDYAGVFDGQRLIAMGGTRACAGGFAEITGVCTHPAYRGRGAATQLVMWLVRSCLQRGGMPFLRVFRDNDAASRLYRQMGFRSCRESIARTFCLL